MGNKRVQQIVIVLCVNKTGKDGVHVYVRTYTCTYSSTSIVAAMVAQLRPSLQQKPRLLLQFAFDPSPVISESQVSPEGPCATTAMQRRA